MLRTGASPPVRRFAVWQAMDDLTPRQRLVVEAPVGRHQLVLAGPGSGKTRIVVARISYLIERAVCQPEQILAMTFTLQAAEELRDRLGNRGRAGVLAGTFHHVCARMLTDHGGAIGLPVPPRILDEPRQLAYLERAAVTIGCRFDDRGDCSRREVRAHIERRKRRGLEPGGWLDEWGRERHRDLIAAIDEAYCRLLVEDGAFDYDDLLLAGLRLLREDDETATIVRRRFRFVFVDEFHDVSAEQYELLRAIAPPEAGELPGTVLVVADPDQAIFGWRGADPDDLLVRFRREYAPVVRRLIENFRSTRSIVRAAHGVLGDRLEVPVVATETEGHKVHCVGYRTVEAEADHLAALVRRAIQSGHYDYDDVAVLYRTHDRADLAEQALIRAGVPIRRVKRDRFFDDPDVQETLRHLDLVAALSDPSFEPALNWPRVVVDEVTMIHLRRVAGGHGLRLSDLAARIEDFTDEVSPLTRSAIREFLDGFARELRPLAGGSVEGVVSRLLDLLRRRWPVIPASERATLRGVFDFLGQPLVEPVARLRAAVEAGRPIAVVPDERLDAIAAAVILEHGIGEYLAHPVILGRADEAPRGAFVLRLGPAAPPDQDGFSIGVRTTRTARYGVAMQTWRLVQRLLMSYETLANGRFVIFDMETGSLHANTTEILELAAVRIERGQVVGEPFHQLVRPPDPTAITYDAAARHGLRWRDVRDAPPPEVVVPAFLAYVGEDTLVGHNAAEFDGRILTRIARGLGRADLTNPLLDTLPLARRLFPGESLSLADLAGKFGLDSAVRHRALADARLTAGVFLRLLDEQRLDRELDVLGEALPLVAVANQAAGTPATDEFALLGMAAARAMRVGLGATLLRRCEELAGKEANARARAGLDDSTRVASADERLERLSERWRDTIRAYMATADDASLQGFLHFAALATPIDGDGAGDGRVTMMTVHSAKGKEWPLVFLLGVEDGTLPSWRAQTDAELAEERRVLYVGISRAMRQAVLTWAANVGGRERRPSRFLQELGDDVVVWKDWRSD
jgi:superfamily I DNA/RNA helicase